MCRNLVDQEPSNSEAWSLLGSIELQTGRFESATHALEHAATLVPDSAAKLVNLGLAYGRAGALARASEVLERALELQPGLMEAAFNLALVRLAAGQLDAAEALLLRVLHENPALPARKQLGKVHSRRGDALLRQRNEAAIASFRQSLEFDPLVAANERKLASALLMAGDLAEGLDALERALSIDPTLSAVESSRVFNAAFSPRFDAEQLLKLARDYVAHHLQPYIAKQLPHESERLPERRLRVGYVSGDFHDHTLRLFVTPVLRCHDRRDFEVHCYSSEKQPDDWTERLKGNADVWHDVAEFDDDALASKIRADGIDILVDLSMHMTGNRLAVFAQRPAPVQLCWFAYPGTTGLEAIDFRITDPHLDPPGAPLPYAERSLHLPHSFWCYEPGTDEPSVNELPASSNGYVTFGCLNNFLKLNPEVFALFARVLEAVPECRLLVLAPSERARQLALSELTSRGIANNRVSFQGLKWRQDYLRSYHNIDIALDCFPYNGHTTSFDAHWMGVPVVTLLGKTAVGRAGLCQAHHLGLRHLVAEQPDDYVGIAKQMAQDLPALAKLRRELRPRLTASPLMDGGRFTRDLEALYREAWRRYCEKFEFGSRLEAHAETR